MRNFSSASLRIFSYSSIGCQENVLCVSYNLVPRSAVVLVGEGTVQVMEYRETYADIVSRYWILIEIEATRRYK
jgi:hypothetical protein